MEDGESGVQVQRAIGRVRDEYSTIQMGGIGDVYDQQHMVTEMPVHLSTVYSVDLEQDW